MSKLKSIFEFIMALLGFLLDFGKKRKGGIKLLV